MSTLTSALVSSIFTDVCNLFPPGFEKMHCLDMMQSKTVHFKSTVNVNKDGTNSEKCFAVFIFRYDKHDANYLHGLELNTVKKHRSYKSG